MPTRSDAPDPQAERDVETSRLLVLGDPEGLRRLLGDHGGRVFALLQKEFRGVLDLHEIEDALGEASLRLWRAGGSFDPRRGSPGAWWFTIARNCARRLLETKRRRPVALVEDVEAVAAALWSPSSLGGAGPVPTGGSQFFEDVQCCIAALPPQQRAVLQADLRAGGCASADSLAEQLGTTRNAVYVARSNGREALRQAMRQLGHRVDAWLDPGRGEAPGRGVG